MQYLAKLYSLIRGNDNVRKGALYTFFAFLNNGLSFILLLILARFILPADYGKLNLFNNLISILSIVICLSTNSYIANSFFQQKKESLNQVVMTVLMVALVMTVILGTFFQIFSSSLVQIIGIPLEFIWIAISICLSQVVINVNLDLWRLEEKPMPYGAFSVSFSIINFIVTFIFVINLKFGWVGRPYAQAIICFLYLIVSLFYLTKRGYLKLGFPSRSIIWQTLMFGLPLVPHAASFWLKQGMDRFIINYYWGAEDVGLYSFAMNFASIINIVGTAFNANNSVYIFKCLSTGFDQTKHSLKRITRIMMYVFLFVVVFACIICYLFVEYLFPKYSSCFIYAVPLCIGAYFQCIYLLYVNYIFYYRKTKQLMYITFTTALIQMVLSLFLTKFGLLYTAGISMGVMILTSFCVYKYSNLILKTNE